jgi:hypothetical protein
MLVLEGRLPAGTRILLAFSPGRWRRSSQSISVGCDTACSAEPSLASFLMVVALAAFRVRFAGLSWESQTVRVLDQERSDEPIAIVRLDCIAQMFGPPNDEASSGHPLASRGLHP